MWHQPSRVTYSTLHLKPKVKFSPGTADLWVSTAELVIYSFYWIWQLKHEAQTWKKMIFANNSYMKNLQINYLYFIVSINWCFVSLGDTWRFDLFQGSYKSLWEMKSIQHTNSRPNLEAYSRHVPKRKVTT